MLVPVLQFILYVPFVTTTATQFGFTVASMTSNVLIKWQTWSLKNKNTRKSFSLSSLCVCFGREMGRYFYPFLNAPLSPLVTTKQEVYWSDIHPLLHTSISKTRDELNKAYGGKNREKNSRNMNWNVLKAESEK